MPNIENRYEQELTQAPEITRDIFNNEARRALGLGNQAEVNAVGVMIQAGKTLVSPTKWMQTAFGGHVSPFVIEKDEFTSWDEINDIEDPNKWQRTIDPQGALPHGIMLGSSANDVTCYMHPAYADEIKRVKERAEKFVVGDPHKYGHGLQFIGGSNRPAEGDCVSTTAWVMATFSYSIGVSGCITPWAEAAKYELYVNPMNFLSSWVKVKYVGRKLLVMSNDE